MRGLLRFLGTIILVVAVVVLVIFAIQNTQAVQASFAGQTFSAGLWWLVIGAAILGFLVAAMLVMPGRISAGWRGRAARRTTVQREQELEALRNEHDQVRAEHERLAAEHRQVVAERDRLRSGDGTAQPVGASTVAPAAVEQRQPAAPTTTVYSADETPAPGQTTMGGAVPPQPQQPSRRQEEWSPNGPAVPTA